MVLVLMVSAVFCAVASFVAFQLLAGRSNPEVVRFANLNEVNVEGLAARLGIGARHLRRLFLEHLGASPVSVAQTRRLHFAKKLLDGVADWVAATEPHDALNALDNVIGAAGVVGAVAFVVVVVLVVVSVVVVVVVAVCICCI